MKSPFLTSKISKALFFKYINDIGRSRLVIFRPIFQYVRKIISSVRSFFFSVLLPTVFISINCLGSVVRAKISQAVGPGSNPCSIILFIISLILVRNSKGSHRTVGRTTRLWTARYLFESHHLPIFSYLSVNNYYNFIFSRIVSFLLLSILIILVGALRSITLTFVGTLLFIRLFFSRSQRIFKFFL